MTDDELGTLIGMRPNEDQDIAIRRFVCETEDAWKSLHTPMKCGHPSLCLVDNYDDGPSICGWCAEVAWEHYRLSKSYAEMQAALDLAYEENKT